MVLNKFLLFLGAISVCYAIPIITTDKVLVDLDISEPAPRRVRVADSKRFPGGIHYTMKQSSKHTHIIGRVMDGEEIIIGGYPRYLSRFVLVVHREDESKYVKVTNRYRTNLKILTSIKEFLKRPGDIRYHEILRCPMDVDVMVQTDDGIVHVTQDTDTKKFFIKEAVYYSAVIGMVKYGDHILDDKVDGLLEREVIWEGGFDAPIITIFSRYNYGTESEIKYRMVTDEWGKKFFNAFSKWKELVDLFE